MLIGWRSKEGQDKIERMRRGALLLLFVLASLELSLNLLLQVESGGQNLASLPIRVEVHSEVFLQ